VAFFLEPLLAHLDRGQFEIFLYHDHPRVDVMSERLRQHAVQWRHFAGMSHAAVEAAIRADAPDILVDLAGHTGLNRLMLFARRLAPVQITYLGYPDTTGLREMDYRFVDAITDPVGEAEAFHTERLVRFAPTAWSYSPPLVAPECAPSPAAATGVVTFGCFNNFSKVTDTTLRTWSQILAAVPGSRLLLKGQGLEDPVAVAALRARVVGLGLDPSRVDLLGRMPRLAAHLEAYGRVDIALDTFPYHGTTTTCEALWMGCPVVTLPGDRHASRVGASLLTSVNRTAWIARDWPDYVRIAVALAGDRAGLVRERASLREAVRTSPLMDHAGQGARFGSALRACWAAWCAKQPVANELRAVSG
jgi:predicted O-linked N-acetylglucosamine transferase (SPINDLY family)